MDSEDPRSPTAELRRFRLSKPGSQRLDTSLSAQPPASGALKLGADRRSAAIITATSDHSDSEHHVEQLRVRSDVSQHQPKDSHLPTPTEQQSVASVIQSVLPAQAGWTPDSPETVHRSSTRHSNSTISYSTDWAPLEPEGFENELKEHLNVANREHTFPQTNTAPLGQGSSSDESQSRVRVPKRTSKESLQAKQAHHISGASPGSSAATSIISSRSHTQRGPQSNGEVNATKVNHPLRDLFPFAKARLDNMKFTPLKSVGGDKRSPENLRRHVLGVVFGWGQDIEELIGDELSRHPSDSMNAIVLSKWLGAADADMASMFASNTMTSSNWMSFALIQMSRQTMTKEMGQTLAGKILKKGDIHVAASILIGIGEHADAIEMYASHLHYMEAILLACLEFPTDSHRQYTLVRRWGEHIMIPSRQLLAIRCLSCTNIDSSESWASLSTEMAECLVNYTRRVGLESSAPSQASPPMPSLGPAKMASSLGQTQPQPLPTTRKTSQDSGLKLITSSANHNSAQGAIITHGRRSGTQLAKTIPDATVEADVTPSSERLAASAKYEQYADQTMTPDIDKAAQRRLSSIGETFESPNSTLPTPDPAPVKSTPQKTKRQKVTKHSGTLPLAVRQGDSSQQPIPSLAYKPRKDTPHPDFQPPFRTRDDLFEASMNGPQQHNSFKDINVQSLTADTQCSSDGETAEKSAKIPTPKPDPEVAQQLSDSNLIAAFREEISTSPPPTGRSFASISTPRSPLCANETTWKIDQFIDGLHLPSSFSQKIQCNRYKEPAVGPTARERSAERGRSNSRVRAPYGFPSASSSQSEEDLSYFGHPNPTSKNHTPLRPQMPSKKTHNRKNQAKHESSNARAGSEPIHHRRTLPNQKPERRLTGRDKTVKARIQPLTDHRRQRHDRNISQLGEKSVIRDEKDHQRRVGNRTRTNDRSAVHDDESFALDITAPDRPCPKKPNEESVLAGPTSRPLGLRKRLTSNTSTSTPFLQQSRFLESALDRLSDFDASSTLTTSSSKKTLSFPTTSGSTLSFQDSIVPFAKTRSAQITTQIVDHPDSTNGIDGANAMDEPIPRPSSCPSPHESIPRRFDLGMHPAFHRDIRPSSSKPGTYPPTRRDPSRGRKPSLGEAWKLVDAMKDESVATACIVAEVPVRDQSTSRTDMPALGHHRGRQSFNEGITTKFKAMADRVRSTSRGANAKSKPPEENMVPATTEAPTNKFKAMAERVRSTSRGRKEVPTNSEVPYLPVQHPPYESLPAMWQREASPAGSITLF